jgi:hypothetical protein
MVGLGLDGGASVSRWGRPPADGAHHPIEGLSRLARLLAHPLYGPLERHTVTNGLLRFKIRSHAAVFIRHKGGV